MGKLSEAKLHKVQWWAQYFHEWLVMIGQIKRDVEWSSEDFQRFTATTNELTGMAIANLPGRPDSDFLPLAELIEGARLRGPKAQLIVHSHRAVAVVLQALAALEENDDKAPDCEPIIGWLLDLGRGKRARLLRFMKDRPIATKQEIEDDLYEGADTPWRTIVSVARRLNTDLSKCTDKRFSVHARRITFGWSDIDFKITKKIRDAK